MTEVRKRPSLFKRQLLVDKKMQFAIIVYSMLVALITILFMAVFILILQNVNIHFDGSGSGSAANFLVLFGLWAGAMSVLTFLGVFVTNKTAGPIYRLRKNMQQVADGGEVENVVFRKGDHFLDIADDYNRVLDRLRKAEGK